MALRLLLHHLYSRPEFLSLPSTSPLPHPLRHFPNHPHHLPETSVPQIEHISVFIYALHMKRVRNFSPLRTSFCPLGSEFSPAKNTGSSRPELLKVWSPGQQCQHHLGPTGRLRVGCKVLLF